MEGERAILLAGVKHCGKSSIGRELAKILTVPFLDSDEELLRRSGAGCASIRALYLKLGEAGFRQAEADLLTALHREGFRGVLALGGGAVGNPCLPPDILSGLGELIWIDVPDAVAFSRIAAGGLPPFLSGAADPAAELARINAVRRKRLAVAATLRFQPEPDRTPGENARTLWEKFAALRQLHENR